MTAGQARPIVCLIGTRPEAIKMAPIVMALRERGHRRCEVVLTSQHRDIVRPLLAWFGLAPDHDLGVMTENQTLAGLTAALLTGLEAHFAGRPLPAAIVAQGDTTTVLAAALFAFYRDVPFAHVEAGLRTGDLRAPFPEEFNRIAADRLAAVLFAPTETARAALLGERIDPERIVVTGNTVIDALAWTAARAPAVALPVPPDARVVLLTLHRRESFGAPIRAVLGAIRTVLDRNPDVAVVFPVHPNPNVRSAAGEILGAHPRAHLCDPLPYEGLVAAMRRSYLVVTDSGGIQEEAPALGKPVLVARDTTERPEAVAIGAAVLVGTDPARIVATAQAFLDDSGVYAAATRGVSPYGDGQAAGRIAEVLERMGA